MQYTLRRIPKLVDRALRERATRDNTSINAAAIDALARGLGLADPQAKRRDLSELAGRWIKDDAADKALGDQRTIDSDLWR